MTEFEKAVESLMEELTKEIGSGLLTHRALELMPPVEMGLQKIKKHERELAAYLRSLERMGHLGEPPLLPPPENGLLESEGKEPE